MIESPPSEDQRFQQKRYWADVLPWTLLSAMVLVFAVGFAWLSMMRHEAYQSHAFDLGNMDQAVWNTVHGDPFRFTDMEVGHVVLSSRLAIHVEPLLLLCSLLYTVQSGPETLLLVQALVVASGAVPAYLLARKASGQKWFALAFPVAYLLHPSIQNAVLDDFHAVTMSAAFLLWAIHFWWKRSLVAFTVAAMLAASTKEEIGLLVALLGILWLRQRRVAGAVVAGAGATWFLVCVLVIIPHFNPSRRSPYLARYEYLGHGFFGVLNGIVTNPHTVARVVTSGPRLTYLDALFHPLAFTPVLGAPILALALPSFAINMLSADPHMYSGYYQYSAEVVPYVICAAIFAWVLVMNLTRRWKMTGARLAPGLLCGLIVVASAAATREYGFSPLADGFSIPSAGPHQDVESHLLSQIPRGAVVAAADEIEPHLSDRRTVYLLPTIRPRNGPPAEYIVLDASVPSLPVRPKVLHAATQQALRHGYAVAAARDGILVLRRGSGAHVIPLSFYTFAFAQRPPTPAHSATWGPLRLLGVTLHPSSARINRARPAIEVETLWSTTMRLRDDMRVRFYQSPVYNGPTPPRDNWRFEDDTSTVDWLPPSKWPLSQTMRVASLPLLPFTERTGKVDVALEVIGEGRARGISQSRRVPWNPNLLRIATVRVGR